MSSELLRKYADILEGKTWESPFNGAEKPAEEEEGEEENIIQQAGTDEEPETDGAVEISSDNNEESAECDSEGDCDTSAPVDGVDAMKRIQARVAARAGNDVEVDEGEGQTAAAKMKRSYNQASADSRKDQAGFGKKIDDMKKSVRAKDAVDEAEFNSPETDKKFADWKAEDDKLVGGDSHTRPSSFKQAMADTDDFKNPGVCPHCGK